MPASALAGSKRSSTAAALAPQLLHLQEPAAPECALDLPGQPRAALDVDLHAEQVARGLREDLRQPGGALDVAGHRILASGALEEHEPLEQVGLDACLTCSRLDLRPPARDARGRRGRPARRARVEHVARAGRRALDERLLLIGDVGERIGDRRAPGLAAGGGRHERHAGGGPVAAQRRAREHGYDDKNAREHDDAGAHVGPGAAHRLSPWHTPRACLADVRVALGA